MLHRSARSPHRATGTAVMSSLIRLVTSMLLVFTGLVVITPTAAQAADGISFSKSAAGSVLLGGAAEFTLTASNPTTGVEQYNLSFTDTLPKGLTYVSGSTSPTNFGEPQVIKIIEGDNGTPGDTSDDPFHQVLVWPNVSDLTPGASQSLTFSAQTDPKEYSIGEVIRNDASAWVSTDPYVVPSFNEKGELEPEPAVTGASDRVETAVTAVQIKKGEGSAEGELLRGVNDHQTVYSLKVTNNFVGPTEELVVTDYLPAGLEFLGCPGKFNSTTPEYEGAGNTVTVAIADCLAPISVDTVELKANDLDGNPVGLTPGVYTKVTWNVGRLDAKGSLTIQYAAGIPQRSNTMTWSDEKPTAESGKQAANLDNNNGSSTRETSTELGLTNGATVAGKYGDENVADDDRETVTAEDLRLLKSVSPSEFTQGQFATYTLDVAVSEYMDASNLSITDVLPPGLCPVQTADPIYTPDAAVAEECKIDQGAPPTNAAITGVKYAADGTYTLTITPDQTAMAANGHVQITYQAMMRANYTIAGNSPTSSLDEFTNNLRISGVTDPRKGVDAPAPNGTEEVSDTSSATLYSTSPTLTKLRMPNADPMNCATDPENLSAYRDTAALPADEKPFTKGDRACFLLKLDFPHGVDTRNVQLTDFLPSYMVYEGYQAIQGDDLTVLMTSGGSNATWTLGKPGSVPRIVPKGSKIYIVLSAIVAKTPPVTAQPQPLAKENLAKLRWTNSAGKSQSLRDAISVPLGPPPPIGILKGVQSINGTQVSGGGSPGGVDGSTVRGGDQVVFRVDPRNLALVGAINATTILAPDIWDVLPAGITCGAISAISDGGTCYDPGVGRPNVDGDSTSSVIRWQLTPAYTIAAGAYGTPLTYTMTIPAVVSVSTVFTNTAAVSAYRTRTNLGGTSVAVHNPANNISADVPAADENVPEASNTSNVVVPNSSILKSQTTSVTDTNNTAATQATIGELVTYTVTVTVPARTTVFNGRMTDCVPDQRKLQVGAVAAPPGTSVTVAPGGCTDANNAAGTLVTMTLPPTYTNSTSADQTFVITIPARVTTTATISGGPAHGNSLANSARFASDTALSSGSAIGPWSSSTTLGIVEPSVSLTKTASPASNVAGNTLVTFTLNATNANERPPLADTVMVDCLPAGLSFTAFSNGYPAGTVAPTPGTDGCAATSTAITWNLGKLAGTGTATSLRFTATVTGTPPSGSSYVNAATVSGRSLPAADVDASLTRPYTASASATVGTTRASIGKTAAQSTLTIGQRGTWTMTVNLPANVVFYDSIITDAMPDGFDLAGLSIDSITCTNWVGACPTSLSALSPSGTGNRTIGWSVGYLPSSPLTRTLVVSYKATVTDIAGNVAGVNRQNTASFKWNLAAAPTPPTSSGTAMSQTVSSLAVTVRIVEPSLRMTKIASDPTPEPGQTITYTVTATNDGNTATNSAIAHHVTLVDTVPAGIVPQVDGNGLVSSGGAWDPVARTITWTNLGPVAVAGNVTVSYTALLAASGTITSTPLSNSVRATHYESLDSGGRTSYTSPSTNATVTPQFPNVTPTKALTNPGELAYVGQDLGWTITLTNTGGADARNATVVDTLPPNWVYKAGSATSSAGSPGEPTIVGQTLTWNTDLTVPAVGAITISFMAHPTAAATATPGTGTGNPHTNTVTATVQDRTGATGNQTGAYARGTGTASTFIHAADLRLAKTSNGGTAHTVAAGTDLIWTLQVTNAGPNPAVGPLTVTDTLPTADVFSTVSVTSAPGWDCSTTDGVLTCTRSGSYAMGAVIPPIQVTAHVRSDADANVSLPNSAVVGSTTFDPTPGNNTAEVTDTTVRVVDIAIDKNATTNPVVAGQNLTYTLAVTNNGPSDGRSGEFVVVDTIPTGTSFVSYASVGNAWDCSYNAGSRQVGCRLTRALPARNPLPTITIVVAVGTDRTTPVVNAATVTGPEAALDPNTGNNTDEVTSPVTTSADLGITKVHSTGDTDWIAGGTGQYTFTVSNYGPSTAAAPRITDQLPASLSYLALVDGAGHWSCSVNGSNLLTCTRDGAMAFNAMEQVVVRVGVASSFTGTTITNTATVGSTTSDPNGGNNSSTDTTGSTRRADLGIDKDGPATALAGNQVSFTLTVTNHGESDSPAPVAGTVAPITVTDTLPAGMTYVSASGSDWTCSATGQVVTCTLGTGLASGASRTITVVSRIGAGVDPQTLRNSANVTGPLPDPGPTPNTDDHDVDVATLADLTITKSVTPATVHAGQQATYTLRVHNDGPSVARDVVVTDPLLTGLTLDDLDAPAGWTCSGTAVSCRVDALAPGAANDAVITVTATVDSGTPAGTLTNVARVSSPTDPSDDTDDADLVVTTRANLELTKSHDADADPVLAGETVEFTLRGSNSGPSDAVAPVRIVDTLPAGMSFVSNSGGWNCTAAGQVVTCLLPDSQGVIAGAPAPTLTMTVLVAADLSPSQLTEGKLRNTAVLTSGTPGTEGTASDEVPVAFDADLAIIKAHVPGAQATIGEEFPFTLTVTNNGPSVAYGVVVTDDLPAGLEYVDAVGDDWDCSADAGEVTCELAGGLAPGDANASTIALTTRVVRQAWPSVTNTATITSDTPDGDKSNNSDDDTVPVRDAANVTITKTADPTSVVAGETVTYTLTASNEGPAAASNVVVDDVLPSDLTFVSITVPTGWTCNNASPIKCEIPSLAANASGVIGITGRVGVSVPAESTISNTAKVSTTTDGDDPTDNSSTVTVAVTTSADLGLAKTASAGAEDWIAGGYGEYTLTVTNNGPSDAIAPRVVDQLPASVTYEGLVNDGAGHWTCVLGTGNELTCDRNAAMAAGTLATPVTESFRIRVKVAAGHTGGIINTASVSSETPDPELKNNDASVTTGTSARADLGIVKDGDASVLAGNSAHFTLTVHNYGESDSPAPAPGLTPITVVDTLPAGMSNPSASGTDWECSADGLEITCELQTGLKAGASAPVINVVADVATNVAGDSRLKNSATVTGPLPQPEGGGQPNTDDHEVLVNTLAALQIVKRANAETVHAGDQVTYTLTVTNNGPSDALDVLVTDPLLPELTLDSATVTAAGWTCQATAPVSCTGGRLQPGAANAVEITVVTTVASSTADATQLVNTATVHSPTDPSDSTANATVTVDTLADLTLTKTHDAAADPILAGDEVEFTLVAHNAGPSDALPTLTIVDTLPVGMSYVSASGWTCEAADATATGQEVTCTLPETTLVAGKDATPLLMKVLVDPKLDPQVTSLTNNAEVTSGTPGEPGTAADLVPVGYRADLAITKKHDPAKVRIGDITEFTLQVSNAGPSAAHRVVVTDALPTGLEFVSVAGTAAESTWTCTEAVGLIECDLDGVLDPETSAEPIVVRAKVSATAYPKVSNVAEVASTTADGDLGNNLATDEVVVPPQVDLGITKTHAPEPLQVGQQGTYTLTVTNTGTTADPGPITVTDTLPTGLAYVSGSGDGWTCTAAGQDVSCVLASGLKTGGTATITLVVNVLPAAYPAVTNVAKVSSRAEDLKPANNQATDPATVLPLYSLGIGKELASQTAGRAIWTITVSNDGPNPAPNGATIVDNLPGMLSYASYSGEGWTCTVVGQVVTCDHPDPIAAGGSVALTLVTTIDSGFSGTVVNSAGIVGGDSDEAEAEVQDASDNLALTGGAAIGAGLLGLGLLGGGALLLVLRRRRLS